LFVDVHSHSRRVEKDILCIENVFLGDEMPENTPFSVGLHPWYINDFSSDTEESLNSYLVSANLVALGELGLDPNSKADKRAQLDAFKQQIQFSEEHKLPVIIHLVKHFDDIVALKRELKPKMPWVIHGFNKNPQLAMQLQREGFYLSFGKSLIVEDSNAQMSFKELDIKKLFLETDDAEDLTIEEVYLQAAKLKAMPLAELKAQLLDNFKTVFSRNDD